MTSYDDGRGEYYVPSILVFGLAELESLVEVMLVGTLVNRKLSHDHHYERSIIVECELSWIPSLTLCICQ